MKVTVIATGFDLSPARGQRPALHPDLVRSRERRPEPVPAARFAEPERAERSERLAERFDEPERFAEPAGVDRIADAPLFGRPAAVAPAPERQAAAEPEPEVPFYRKVLAHRQSEDPGGFGPNWSNVDDYDIPTVLRKQMD
jgi:hypothetical protein